MSEDKLERDYYNYNVIIKKENEMKFVAKKSKGLSLKLLGKEIIVVLLL